MDLEYKEFVRKPFVVQAVEITRDNIKAASKHIGTLCEMDDGTPYIAVNTDLIPNVPRVYLGYWMTRVGINFRCYAKKIFHDQFALSSEGTQALVDHFDSSKTHG